MYIAFIYKFGTRMIFFRFNLILKKMKNSGFHLGRTYIGFKESRDLYRVVCAISLGLKNRRKLIGFQCPRVGWWPPFPSKTAGSGRLAK